MLSADEQDLFDAYNCKINQYQGCDQQDEQYH